MRRSITLGFAAAALACGGAPGDVIGWSDDLASVEPSAAVGASLDFSCPAGGMTGATVWGTDVYTDDSAICPAAVHAGKIDTYYGGTAAIRVEDGRSTYTGSTRHGVVSIDFGAWSRSFSFR